MKASYRPITSYTQQGARAFRAALPLLHSIRGLEPPPLQPELLATVEAKRAPGGRPHRPEERDARQGQGRRPSGSSKRLQCSYLGAR